MILSDEAVNTIYSGVVARGVTSLSDDDPTDTEYLWALASDLQEARKQRTAAREALEKYGEHRPRCAKSIRSEEEILANSWPTCSCGLDASLEAELWD
jgi:hypothetical protein